MKNEVLRLGLDPAYFMEKRIGLIPDPWQKQVLSYGGKRLLLLCSRQAGKSTVASVMALHRALYLPQQLILLVSPTLRQSQLLFRTISTMSRKLPVQPRKLEDNKMSVEYANQSRIVALPGIEQTVRGYSGVNLLVLDEGARVSDELYTAVRPMLAVSNGTLMSLSTPWGKRGWFHREYTEGPDTWERTKITALEVKRIPEWFLAEERIALGEWWYAQEYLCEFRETVDSFFSYDSIMESISDDVGVLFPEDEQEQEETVLIG